MKQEHLVTFLFLLLMFNFSNGQIQSELNHASGNSLLSADNDLNEVYQNIIKNYSSDTLFLKKLLIAQKLWLQFRDAEVEARYPTELFFGSMVSMCRASLLEDLTKQRTFNLKLWLEGMDQKDGCKGTVKVRE
jgi:uncharacterized protein YecT (DUF1311 family)